MKLIELIEQGVDYDDILYHDDWALGMRMCKDLGNAFVYCYPETGKLVKEHRDPTGYKRVVLCKKILADDKWHKRTLVEPKYKVGDRFLLSDLFYSESKTDGSTSHTTVKNTIGEIIASYYDGEKMRYTVSLNGKGFPLLLTEDYLNKLDMVVSQND